MRHNTGNPPQVFLHVPQQCCAVLLAGTSLGSLSNAVGQPQALDFAIRSAAVEDYWSIAEVHAQSFYPSANWLLGPLLRLDRVHALQVRKHCSVASACRKGPRCHAAVISILSHKTTSVEICQH